jgi:fructosamine-3-kinase
MVAALPAPVLAWLGTSLGAEVRHLRPVSGGCIHQSWQVQRAGGGAAFLKTNVAAALPMLEAEVDGLRALAAWAPPELQIPSPLALAEVDGRALLLLSWLDLGPAARADAEGAWRSLGQSLAQLHRASRSGNGGCGYGFGCDNYIGSAPQPNRWCSDWPRFFAEARLQPQLERAARAGRPLRQADRLLALLPAWLAGHGAEPVLVHGDLWSGNAGLVAGGQGALFDPACHWADREVDLAMARLFGGFPASFFSGYETEWPLPAGDRQRRDLYNLYHLLNHANLFGGSYWQASQACIDGLLAAGPPG